MVIGHGLEQMMIVYILRQRTDETERGESSYVIEYIEKEDLADGEYSIQECIY